MATQVVLVGTFDTKSAEYSFLREHIEQIGMYSVTLIDVGLKSDENTTLIPDVSSKSILELAVDDPTKRNFSSMNKATLMDLMSSGLAKKLNELFERDSLHGILALGGSCGTAIVSDAIQRSKVLPIGLPKMIVSTLAGSSNAHTAVGLTDVTLMHSVTDIGGGINQINEQIFINAANGIAAMANGYRISRSEIKMKVHQRAPLVGLTMFGVTTPCVMEAKRQLEQLGYETVIFHAVGTGGKAMEYLIDIGSIHAVLDITTTELADELVGGILSAGPDRLEMAAKKGIPHIVSLGALDMVNFGPLNTVPNNFRQNRHLFEHNSQITLMRTTSDECAKLGEIIAKKLNEHRGERPIEIFIPIKGFSALSVQGQPFYDPNADASLIQALHKHINPNKVKLIERNESINETEFARSMVEAIHNQLNYKKIPKTNEMISNKLLTMPRNRRECLQRLNSVIASGRTIIGSGAGIGLSAKCIEEGGADLLIIYNSGRFRMAGRGSLAGLMSYSDANAVMFEMAAEVLPVVKHTPVLAGVCGTDPFRLLPQLLRQIKEVGFLGVQNFPTVGLIDGQFRQSLEETGMGYELEVEMIRLAHQLDLVTAPYVFNVDEARLMTEAGADIIVAHMGLTTKGAIGARSSLTLDESVERIQAIHDVSVKINPKVIVLCHGGPLAEPDDVQYLLKRTRGVKGFFGASSMERLPTEIALVENTKRFKQLTLS